jgi:hypothetical protein
LRASVEKGGVFVAFVVVVGIVVGVEVVVVA